MKRSPAVLVLATVFCASCSINTGPQNPPVVKAEKDFASGGRIEMELDAGDYQVHAADGDRIRVSFSGNSDGATADLSNTGPRATLAIKNTPHNNFHATIEVPKTSDLVLRLAAGNLEMAGIAGSKDIDSKAGNVEIGVGSPNDYAGVDATVKVGNLSGGPFGEPDGTLSHHLAWTGPGKYNLRANLGAGNLELK
ncbi:MAG TPA: hypothetical protein VKT49_24610 [Bryobacteraceae bacterium]|nr:hypothetical protein [Bryobacteraceae bacterium]